MGELYGGVVFCESSWFWLGSRYCVEEALHTITCLLLRLQLRGRSGCSVILLSSHIVLGADQRRSVEAVGAAVGASVGAAQCLRF